jgi:hypothetical protein
MMIAMARPTNLHDVHTKASLTTPMGLDVQNLIKEFTLAQAPQQSTSDGTVMDTHSQRHLKLFQTLLFIYEYIWST